ncbi:hypothetical protein BGZ65_007539 [Modicella reniformis]|uniref:HEAT repeat domain-containing protein n=1 Tax=Modicella reniformis TaxID=1440133 RepID=A0A9P6MFR5_9FUNG|nr:hypothetical protein BGZ65_007539 [Modicella reniformis]
MVARSNRGEPGAIKDFPLSVSETAIRVLGEQAKLTNMALRELARITRTLDIAVVAFEVLNTIARSESGIQRLIELQDQDSDIRKAVVRVLGEQIEPSQAVLEALAGAVRDKNADVSEAAIKVLEIQDTLPEAAIHTLIGALQDENSLVRINAVRVLEVQSRSSSIAEIETSQAILKALAGAVRDKGGDVSEDATKVLEVKDTLPEAAIRTLIGVLQDENSSVRINAGTGVAGSVQIIEYRRNRDISGYSRGTSRRRSG